MDMEFCQADRMKTNKQTNTHNFPYGSNLRVSSVVLVLPFLTWRFVVQVWPEASQVKIWYLAFSGHMEGKAASPVTDHISFPHAVKANEYMGTNITSSSAFVSQRTVSLK